MGDISATGLESVCAGILLGQSAALKDRILDRHLLPLGITAAQIKVLRIIAAGDTTAGGLCRQLSIHSAAMSRMLDRLERKALVARTRDAHDHRQVRVALTAKGSAVSGRLPELISTAMNEFTASLGADELAQLKGILEKVLLRCR